MFGVGEKVIYGIHGVCLVAGLEEKIVDRKTVTYLVLEPVSKDGSRFLVPTHNAAAMGKLRRMLEREELAAMLESEAVLQADWIAEENLRKQRYRELISGGDRVSLMRMVHSIYRHKASQAVAGKKCHLCDENFLRDAEKLLSGEISLVMGLEPGEARTYLRSKLQ